MSTFFIINDNNEDSNEGVAGRAWFTNAQYIVPDLPEWPTPTRVTNSNVYAEYARMGHVTIEKAERLNVKSRSIMATVVRNAQGKRWGVLTIDSRNPGAITIPSDRTIPPDKTTIARLGAELLTQIL